MSYAMRIRPVEEVEAAETIELVSRYGLTPAEYDVAGRLARGESPAAIARATGRALDTVRTHLKSIFMKTGTHRQVELVILVNACARGA